MVIPASQPGTQTLSQSRHSFDIDGQGAGMLVEHQNGSICRISLVLHDDHEPLVQHLLDAYFRLVVDQLTAGTPLAELLPTMLREQFPPAGMTNREDVFFAGSLIDYVGRKLAVEFLDETERFLLLYQQPPPNVQPPSS